ncbi:chromatin-remodeling ATPase INO80 isoform X2 [Anthonomus grandis grandis]|uniref:chromatin-remodeling ATPase INO80 isoform X2 n=1 Tax=Anthonomus grandis grandis TaxID=2921223 RepID=UPI0021668A85|nr:chromatin-remodeling ATPase INO80 isoform X2 [Anthonomus grandis grandis]
MAHNFKNHLFEDLPVLKPVHVPNNTVNVPESQPSCSAKPMHIRRLEKALDLGPFLNSFLKKAMENLFKEEQHSARDYYNFSNVTSSRRWLANVLSENIDAGPEDAPYKCLLKMHAYQKKLRKKKNVNFDLSMYYGAGLISTVDLYPEIEKSIPATVRHKDKLDCLKHELRSPLYDPDILDDISNEPCLDLNLENGLNEFPNLDNDLEDTNGNTDFAHSNLPLLPSMPLPPLPTTNHVTNSKRKNKKFKDDEAKKKWEEIMALKRRKLFTSIAKKEIGKQHRAKSNKHKEMLLQCKRVAAHCVKYARQKALQSARTVKEQQWRMKRLARENIAYWKRSRRFDREVKKRLEKEAEEQRKIDHELVEAKRQQRKLNFLITQTELYAHFMSKKLGSASTEEQLRILSQLDEEKTALAGDDYDSEIMKEKAKRNAQEAFQSEKARTKNFDQQANSCLTEVSDILDGEQPQPQIFTGKLKGYQLKGMNWLANLYSQGISGILADEMGLGKTVQSIAFLCHIAEKYSVWGPFLIISPASTLHNWQQEIAKFVPNFKVVPYWGNPNERKILRQFWDQKDIYTKDASFHIVITSYQIVITDIKYFNRIKWQYMILDEAQAIKSTSSMRWKTLLGFSCRNRLLLSGTPIQNSMAELWALLHFIMPTLFDSHDEFNEWFSKDIESHAENKTGIDEKHLSRLHMILKPFMLRRIKKDVENELSDKIEIMVYCPLTTRQNLLYLALKQKIKIEDLLHYSVGGGDTHNVDKNFTSNLMNLVMQFRKVCNHPELFERRDAKSPIRVQPIVCNIPFLVYDTNIRQQIFLKLNKMLLFTPEYISQAQYLQLSLFSFMLLLGISTKEIFDILLGDIVARWKSYFDFERSENQRYLRKIWDPQYHSKPTLAFKQEFRLSDSAISNSSSLTDLMFGRNVKGGRMVYTHQDHIYHSMPETVEHRNIRFKKKKIPEDENVDVEGDAVPFPVHTIEFPHKNRPSVVLPCEKTEIPFHLFCAMPKVSAPTINLYCYSRKAAWDLQRHIDDYSFNSLNYHWSQATGHKYPVLPCETLYPQQRDCVEIIRPKQGWSNIAIPDKESLVTDSGKLFVLDGLLRKLKEEGHRVLIYSQMTKMIDLLEEYMWHRHHKYMRLDGSSKISERRDMVADFQARADIFVFLLSTRAGGLGINLTAADTVIFYDSDWNPTVDQQAMDRAHRLGQTKQVTVYRLICKGSIEERILQRAREKSEIQKLVISGGNFKPDTLKPKEVVSLLLDDDELVQKYHLKVENKSAPEETRDDKKRKLAFKTIPAAEAKRAKMEPPSLVTEISEEPPHSPSSEIDPDGPIDEPDILNDDDSPITNKYTVYNVYGSAVRPRAAARGHTKRGRPRGSRARIGTGIGRNNAVGNGPILPGLSNAQLNSFGEPSTSTSTHDSASSVSSTQSSPRGAGVEMMLPSPSDLTGISFSPCARRGPGRPRLKPNGPAHAGSRNPRPRKPARPLPVPLPTDPAIAQASTYSFYEFPDD